MQVPVRAKKFCEMLCARYRINIFDQLVYADADVEITEPSRQVHETFAPSPEFVVVRVLNIIFLIYHLIFLHQAELCTAASVGDLDTIMKLLKEGADPNAVPNRDNRSVIMSFHSFSVRSTQVLIRLQDRPASCLCRRPSGGGASVAAGWGGHTGARPLGRHAERRRGVGWARHGGGTAGRCSRGAGLRHRHATPHHNCEYRRYRQRHTVAEHSPHSNTTATAAGPAARRQLHHRPGHSFCWGRPG
jgi:hypothetical protein